MTVIYLEKTRSGLPAAWEEGGGYTNTGRARIIAHADGSPKKPVYIRRSGDLACREHALFVVREGDLVIEAHHHRRDFEIAVYRIAKIRPRVRETWGNAGEEPAEVAGKHARHHNTTVTNIVKVATISSDSIVVWYETDELAADLESIHTFRRGEWDTEPTGAVAEAIRAAMEKATDWHCREPYYYRREETA